MDLKKLPKVELHLHLDGSVNLSTAKKIINKEVYNDMVANNKCKDLNEYLTKFKIPISIMQTKENLTLVSKELGLNLINDSVIYAEVRFAPILHINNGLTLEEVVNSVLKGFENLDIKINLILCMLRNETYENNLKIIYLAKKYLNKGVCGIDLAGAENLYKTESFKSLFDLAKIYKIPFTIHAGEADGPDSILSAISFETKRIGHGIRCIEDNKLVNRIIKSRITLEICPTSNVQTNVIDKYEDNPIYNLYKKGVLVTINTDNRTVSNITLTEEYNRLIKYFNFNIKDIIQMNINAINASFLSIEEKEKLITKIKSY